MCTGGKGSSACLYASPQIRTQIGAAEVEVHPGRQKKNLRSESESKRA
jgi:hypothetical protein